MNLQENSAYGTWTGKQERNSTEALMQLARLAKARSANVCLLLTWATLDDTSATNFKGAQVLIFSEAQLAAKECALPRPVGS